MDFTTMRNAMTAYIASHGITPDKLPIFILYNVEYSQNGDLFLGGYHFSEATYPNALTTPGQTYIVANFRTVGNPPFDTAILSHEIAEWMDDPGGYNGVPAWGHVGEVAGCQGNLEVGDPLTQTDLPPIVNQSDDPLYDTVGGSRLCGTPQMGAYLDRCGYGTRLPLLVISPYARQNYVDHAVTDLTSITRFIEDNWSLGRLGDQSFDALANSLNGLFDFIDPPRSGRQLILDANTG
jgi:hypothetical protein